MRLMVRLLLNLEFRIGTCFGKIGPSLGFLVIWEVWFNFGPLVIRVGWSNFGSLVVRERICPDLVLWSFGISVFSKRSESKKNI